jgi:beta-lactamase regulating signal transducer with metallopeptidase domain
MNIRLWFPNLLFWSAQVALLVLAAGFLPRLLQIRQPRVLLAYWRALLAISLVLPFVQPWHRVPSIGAIVIAPDIAGTSVIPVSSPTVTHWHIPGLQIISQIFGTVILSGVATRFVLLVLGLLKLRQFRRASLPISPFAESTAVLEEMRTRMNARAEFRLSADVYSPVTFGFAAPVILLPEQFPFMDARFQAAIACHELLHVHRQDWANHLAEEIIRAALWFHPAIAWLIARVRLAREQVVDLEVVKLTKARKPYLEALLQFTVSRARIAAIPAPPFLVERQLAERVALMLEEVRMSRTRLIASSTAIACWLALAMALATRAFPLKRAPLAVQSAPRSGVAQGVSGGVAGGVAQGISGGVAGGVTGGIKGGVNSDDGNGQFIDQANVDRSTIWIDTVKKGPMLRQVRGLGTLVRAEDSTNLVARVILPDFMTHDVQLNQNAVVDTRKGLVKGHVSHISPTPSNGMRSVDIALDAALREGVSADLAIDGTIDIEKLEDVLYVGRPIHSTPNTSISLFKIISDGTGAARVNVKFGRASVQTIEVLDGLKAGDKIILSDMSTWDKVDQIHLK